MPQITLVNYATIIVCNVKEVHLIAKVVKIHFFYTEINVVLLVREVPLKKDHHSTIVNNVILPAKLVKKTANWIAFLVLPEGI